MESILTGRSERGEDSAGNPFFQRHLCFVPGAGVRTCGGPREVRWNLIATQSVNGVLCFASQGDISFILSPL